jgi:hypothetical protein
MLNMAKLVVSNDEARAAKDKPEKGLEVYAQVTRVDGPRDAKDNARAIEDLRKSVQLPQLTRYRTRHVSTSSCFTP